MALRLGDRGAVSGSRATARRPRASPVVPQWSHYRNSVMAHSDPIGILGDSHFSLQHRPGLTELATTMDCVELFHATSHGDGTRGFIVAVPSSQPGDDPACRREAREQMRVALALCVAFETWAEGGESFDFRSAEHGGCGQSGVAVTLLGELNIDARCFGCSRGEFDQAFGAGNLTIFQLQTVGF